MGHVWFRKTIPVGWMTHQKRERNNSWLILEDHCDQPGGSKTVLTKIEFFNKMPVLPQRGNDLCHWKSDKFGRPNLGVFWGNVVFTTVKYNFLLHFDRTKWGIFFFIRACATCLQSSGAGSCTYWRSAIATFWHIKWDLCAWHPKLLGWIVCSSYTQHQ